MDKQWILYKTTNLVNGKIYIGVHKVADNYRSKNYLGSGQALRVAFKKYGRKNFTRVTLAKFSCSEDAYSAEANIVNEKFIKHDDNYNMKCGGKGARGFKHTDASKAKVSAGNKGKIRTEEFKEKISASLIGNTRRLGKIITEEHKAKLQAANSKAMNAKKKPVMIDGKYYETARFAAKIEGIPRNTLWNRLKSANPKWSEWYFLATDNLG